MARTHAHVRDGLQRERSLLLEGLVSEDASSPTSTADVGDIATSRIEQFADERERQRRQERIAQIESALLRLEEGDWGKCERCGDRIGGARLEALPTATTCVGCASAR